MDFWVRLLIVIWAVGGPVYLYSRDMKVEHILIVYFAVGFGIWGVWHSFG